VNNELYLLARADAGIHTWKFNAENNSWSKLASNSPGWSDASGWDDVTNYSTIQTAVVNNELYLLARANTGIHTWKFNKEGIKAEWLEPFLGIMMESISKQSWLQPFLNMTMK
ncbi:MAG: hypothetical protein GY845_21310, partial [Planctomycetes bacterium]|nr:hypothetical protein [Planctomycetota bacterium]